MMSRKLLQIRSLIIGVRQYGRGLRRKPIRIVIGKEEPSITTELESQTSYAMQKKPELILENKKSGKDKNLNIPKYIKLGEKDGEFLKIISQVRSHKQRDKSGKLLLEGKRLIIDAIDAGSEMETIFFSKEETLVGIPFNKIPDVKIMKVFYKKLSVWSDLTTSPGIMGVCKKPDYKTLALLHESTIPLTIICDNVRDPGNMGSLLRCAAAVGCNKIILTKGCVDAWEPKVLRAACGAHFHIPIISDLSWDILMNYLPENGEIFLADNSNDIEDGVSHKRTIYEHAHTERFIEKQEEVIKVDPSHEDEETLRKYKKLYIPQYDYTEIKYDKDSILVIGGETEGISAQAKKLASVYDGCRIKIPTANNVESLNSAMSMAIIAYEIKRQLCSQNNTENVS